MRAFIVMWDVLFMDLGEFVVDIENFVLVVYNVFG